jgi:5-methylcytosine-specific restriction enzyme A
MMLALEWESDQYKLFSTTNIENRVNADKLFLRFLIAVEKSKVDLGKVFTIREIMTFIPRESSGIKHYATYGFSFMSMLSTQKNRDYFIFENPRVRDEFTSQCQNRIRDNFYWRKHYLEERVRINPKYLTV